MLRNRVKNTIKAHAATVAHERVLTYRAHGNNNLYLDKTNHSRMFETQVDDIVVYWPGRPEL